MSKLTSSVSRKTSYSLLASLGFLLFSSCAHQTTSCESGLPHGDPIETLVILGTNDIHGTVVPTQQRTRDPVAGSSVEYQTGGLALMASYIRELKVEFKDHLIWLDAGDEFQGSLESNLNGGVPLVQFYNRLGLTAAAIGNHEFDFGVPVLESRMREARYPYLAANIMDKSSGTYAQFPNTLNHMTVQVGRLKVGIFGLSTLETPTTTLSDHVASYSFEDLKSTTLKEAQGLRREGADIVLLVAHVGLFCDVHTQAEKLIHFPKDIQGSCGKSDEMVQLLNSIPEGTLDAVVAGHSHQVVHHWVNGTPVIQSAAYGQYLSLIYLNYDWSRHRILTDTTRIEGPIPVCEKIFKNRKDCNGDVQDLDRGPLIPAIFRGKKIHPDLEVENDLRPTVNRVAEVKARVVTQAARPVEHERQAESAMGNLVTDAIRASAHAQIAIINSGGIRAPWEAGTVTYGSVYRTLPFDNFIITLKLKGRDLRRLLAIAESGSKGISPVSGVQIRMLPLSAKNAPSQDLSGDGKIEPWEVNRILSVKLSDGSPLRDSKTYTVATLDFLVHGGDDWGWIVKQLSAKQIGKKPGKLERDALLDYLESKKEGSINSSEHPLIDPKKLRFEFKN